MMIVYVYRQTTKLGETLILCRLQGPLSQAEAGQPTSQCAGDEAKEAKGAGGGETPAGRPALGRSSHLPRHCLPLTTLPQGDGQFKNCCSTFIITHHSVQSSDQNKCDHFYQNDNHLTSSHGDSLSHSVSSSPTGYGRGSLSLIIRPLSPPETACHARGQRIGRRACPLPCGQPRPASGTALCRHWIAPSSWE